MNRKSRTAIFLAAVLGLAALGPRPALAGGTRMEGGAVKILRNQETAGGQVLAAGAFALNNSLGQVGAIASAGGSFQMFSGLQHIEAQPGSVVSITTMTKSTGTLDLVWDAPGADGFLGPVANGFYRVDYSSDPNHVFSPLTYQLEFSTTVSAGEPQSLQLSGLLPNTTFYTKIYLADARKYFAEDSTRSDQSTLANAPVNPVFASVFASSAVITWTLPSFGGEGFAASASSTNFGGLLPGGAVATSTTSDGVQVSLTIDGLSPNTTYFFKVASLNWQGDKNYSVVIGTVTGNAAAPIFNLASFPNALGHSVSMTWSNPNFAGMDGVLVVVSTNPASPPVLGGQSYSVGQVLSDSSVVRSTAVATAFSDAGLILDKSYYYSFYTRGSNAQYSVSVSTSIFLDLPPLAPAALTTIVSNNHITITWNQVTSNLDGSSFYASTAAELARYDVYRATSPVNPNWGNSIASLSTTTTVFVDTMPFAGPDWTYKVVAVDSFENEDAAMAKDISNNLYVYGPDQATQFKIPPELLPMLRGATNGYGSDIIVRATPLPTDLPLKVQQKVFRDVRFDAYRIPGNELVPDFQFPTADAVVSLSYAVAGGQVVPMSSLDPLGIPADDAANSLSMYWSPQDNGQYHKLFGKVDTVNQTVSVKSPRMGDYQIRALQRSLDFNFDASTLSNKVITPNGDGLNDVAIFTIQNPKDSAFSGQIFDVTGALVTDMALGPSQGGGISTLQWNAKANGHAVPGGVYIYQIRGEGKVFNGTVLVVR